VAYAVLRFVAFALAFVLLSRFAASSSAKVFWSFSMVATGHDGRHQGPS
jgi:hypothetical protein